MLDTLRKMKRLVTGERIDLKTGELVDHELRLREPVDPLPLAPPVNYKREPSMMEIIKGQLLRDKVERLQAALGAESAEEAEDFDIEEDDGEPNSEYETERHDMQLLNAMAKAVDQANMMHRKYGKKIPDHIAEYEQFLSGEKAPPPPLPDVSSKPKDGPLSGPTPPDRPGPEKGGKTPPLPPEAE